MTGRITVLVACFAILSACISHEQNVTHGTLIDGTRYPLPQGFDPGLRPVHILPPDYPFKALDHLKDGFVDLTFRIKADGSIDQIRVIQEVPANLGFAESALRVFPHWTFPPREDAMVGTYRITFFRFGPEAEPRYPVYQPHCGNCPG